MGSKLSKRSNNSTTPSTSNGSDGSSSAGNIDLTFYLEACQLDPDVQTFDSKLHHHATSVINTLSFAQDSSEVCSSLSFESLTQVTGSLMEMNQEVVRVIHDCKNDIWKNKDLLNLVEDYFEYSIQTLDFFTSLDQCLKRARDRQFIIQVALGRFEEELGLINGDSSGNACDKFARTLQELTSFKEAGDPFGAEFFTLFRSVYNQQVIMLQRLQHRKRKLDKKLKSVKVYRKVSNIIFATTCVALVICSVVAAFIADPHVAAILAAAASAPVGGMGKWFTSLWKRYEKELKDQKDLVTTMELKTRVTVKDLVNIRVLVDKLEVEIEALLSNVDSALGQAEMLTVVIDEIQKKLDVFMEGIDNLTAHSDKYSREIRQARTVILHSIIKYPSAPA